MNGSLVANTILLDGLRAGEAYVECELAVCVPSPYLAQVQTLLAGSAINWGAQDISVHESGAYTGEISAQMLLDFNCRYVIVGHSERRSYHAETSELVAKKAARAVAAGLVPVICVGETLAQRDAGQTAQVVEQQLTPVLEEVGAQLEKIVIAYEPVWAIGTGKTATPAMAQEVHELIRARLAKYDATTAAAVRLLYGGSMKPDNAKELLAMPDIDGGLIGGASLKAADFLDIARAA